jgi:RNA polymerase sigma-70 factor (ECF subfamily)
MPSLLLDTCGDPLHGLLGPAAGQRRAGGAPARGCTHPAVNAPEEPSSSAIRSATRGDPASIEDLLRAYLPRLQRFVHLRLGAALRRREDTLDIVQSTVRELLGETDFEWRGEVEFRAWLFQAALNKIRQKVRFHAAGKRAAAREVGALAPDAAGLGDAVRDLTTPSRVAMAREELDRLEAAFGQLTEAQREVLTLARVAGLPHAVIARRVGKSEVAVRQLLVRAMAALGAALGPDP